MARLTLLVIGLLLSWPTVALADSDGYFCAGRGYLAYETRFTASGTQHVLHILRFSRAGGIGQLQHVPLDDFQTHGMSCGDRVIELAGWTTRYRFDISVPERPRITMENGAYDSQRTPQMNLGHWSREGVTDLESDGQPGEFQLVISRVDRRIAGGIEHYTVTQLVRRETRPGGRILAAQKLFEGIFLETIDLMEIDYAD